MNIDSWTASPTIGDEVWSYTIELADGTALPAFITPYIYSVSPVV